MHYCFITLNQAVSQKKRLNRVAAGDVSCPAVRASANRILGRLARSFFHSGCSQDVPHHLHKEHRNKGGLHPHLLEGARIGQQNIGLLGQEIFSFVL